MDSGVNIRTTRASRAGLKTFLPSPPKSSLARATAMNEPMATTHRGVVGGSRKAKSSPVTMALMSDRVTSRRVSLRISTSERAAVSRLTVTM